jgi:hypothetical protein
VPTSLRCQYTNSSGYSFTTPSIKRLNRTLCPFHVMMACSRTLYSGQHDVVNTATTRSVVGRGVVWVRLAGLRPGSSSWYSADAVRNRCSARVCSHKARHNSHSNPAYAVHRADRLPVAALPRHDVSMYRQRAYFAISYD